jgi:uncharacterized phiE125 gp8 family phage protein
MSLTVTSFPLAEPLTVNEAKDHLQIDRENSRFDTLIESQIMAARVFCEKYLGRSIVRTSYSYKFNSFSGSTIELPKSPVISVDSITYIDAVTSPQEQTISTDVYALDKGVHPPVVYLQYDQTWPTSRGGRNDISINFTAGYEDSIASPRDYDDQVPEAIKAAMKIIIGDLFLNRERRTDIQTYHNDTAEMFLDLIRSRSTV